MDDLTAIGGASLLLRVGAGTVFLAHGIPKLLPANPGVKVGREKLVSTIAQLGFPWPGLWASAVAALQAAGGALLILGLGTSWVAAALAVVMVVATYWQSREGFVLGADFPFALLCALVALAMLGDGRFSLGGVLGW